MLKIWRVMALWTPWLHLWYECACGFWNEPTVKNLCCKLCICLAFHQDECANVTSNRPSLKNNCCKLRICMAFNQYECTCGFWNYPFVKNLCCKLCVAAASLNRERWGSYSAEIWETRPYSLLPRTAVLNSFWSPHPVRKEKSFLNPLHHLMYCFLYYHRWHQCLLAPHQVPSRTPRGCKHPQLRTAGLEPDPYEIRASTEL